MPPRLLLVEDDELLGRAIGRLAASRMSLVHVASATEARRFAATNDEVDGFLVDVGLPEADDEGLRLLPELRQRWKRAVGAVFTGRPVDEIVNFAFEHDALTIRKTDHHGLVTRFFDRVAETRRVRDLVEARRAERIRDRVRRCARAYDLSARQERIVELTAHGMEGAAIDDALGISTSTRRAHVSALLERTGAPSLSALVIAVLRGDDEA